MNRFIFDHYIFDKQTFIGHFKYGFEDERVFEETVQFERSDDYDELVLEKALFLAFIIIGVSYYKLFPGTEVILKQQIDDWQSAFFSSVYQEGLGQFAYENNLTRNDLAHFVGTTEKSEVGNDNYIGKGYLVLQSGGKDSLLVSQLLKLKGLSYTSWYLSSGSSHPSVLDNDNMPLAMATRHIDIAALKLAIAEGGKNGHVPITYIVQSLAIVQAVLLGKSGVIVSIAHEGEEPHGYIDDLAITHQWSKTWRAEQEFSEYVNRYISTNIRIGSPLRGSSELLVAEKFVKYAWSDYGDKFSSCNVANYQQGNNNTFLKWCGNCPKCANSYLLFAPFIEIDKLKSIFGGVDLFLKPTLKGTFKGLLGVDGESKPFECVGEIDELRLAYSKSQSKSGYGSLGFDVPESSFDYKQIYPAQAWAVKMIQ